MPESKHSAFSPEAKAYRKALKQLSPGDAPMPSDSDLADLRPGFQKVRARRLANEAGSSPEAVAAEKAGKERLKEVIERGDLTQSIINRLAVYLGCEPWEALAKTEKNKRLLSKLIAYSQRKDSKLKTVCRRGDVSSRPEAILTAELGAMFLDQDVMAEFAQVVRRDDKNEDFAGISLDGEVINDQLLFGKNYDDKGRSYVSPITLAKKAWLGSEKASEWVDTLRTEERTNTDLSKSVVQDEQVWTALRILATELPNEFGYKDANEAEKIIGAYVEKIGRSVDLNFRFLDGAAYKYFNEDRLREQLDSKILLTRNALNIAQTKGIVKHYKQNLLLIEQANSIDKLKTQEDERKLADAMSTKYQELLKVNEEIASIQMSLRRFSFSNFVRDIFGSETPLDDRLRDLNKQQLDICLALGDLSGDYRREIKDWTDKAEKDAEAIVDRDEDEKKKQAARAELAEMKKQIPGK
ncbi:MAG: hypothetical protein WAZ14_02375 [Patescibacteria group bacterium]